MKISYLAAVSEPLLELDQEQQAISLWQENKDAKALELLIRSHARQVYACVKRATPDPMETEELFSEGVFGLIKAANRFDLERGVRFSTYAHWWILNSVNRGVARLKSVVDIPQKAKNEGSQPGFAELGKFAPLALDGKIDDLEIPTRDHIQSKDPTPEERMIQQSHREWMRECIENSLSVLDDVEREIIRSRSLTEVPVSIEHLSETLGLNRELLRKVERRALSRLRFDLMAKGITGARMV